MKTLSPTKPKPSSKVGAAAHALAVQTVKVNEHCTGSRWIAADMDRLARVVAIIAMGQAKHAERIIAELLRFEPAINLEELRANARSKLSITGTSKEQRDVSRYHRDGLMFEVISWAAARQTASAKTLLRDPHLSSTTQGLDGLMIELDGNDAITRSTIFEDKCSEYPRAKFRDEILPAFKAHHNNVRASDLLAAAAALIGNTGLDGTKSTEAAARVLDKAYRAYRGSLAVTTADDSVARRQALFKDYEELDGMDASQRVAAMLVTAADLRTWFEELADRALAFIDELGAGGA